MNLSVSEIKRLSRGILTGHYYVPMRVMMLVILIPMTVEYAFSAFVSTSSLFQIILYYIVEVLIGVISEVLFTGQCLVHICMARNEYYGVGFAFYCFRNRSNHYFLGAILMRVITLVTSAPLIAAYLLLPDSLGNLTPAVIAEAGLLAAAGLLLTLLRHIFFGIFYYVMLDDEEDTIRQNLKTTFSLIKGRKKKLFSLYLSFLGMYLLVILSMGIGLLWINPYLNESLAVFYMECLGESVTNGSYAEESY